MKSRFVFYSGAGSLWTVLVAAIFGTFLLMAAGAWGLAKVAEWLVPSLGVLAVLALTVFIFVVVPCSWVPPLRSDAARAARLLASGYDLGIWLFSFFAVWQWLGLWALPTLLLPFLAPPLAILRLMYLSDGYSAAGLLLAMAASRGMKWYGLTAGIRASGDAFRDQRSAQESEVIDTVVVEERREIEKKDL